MAGRAEGGAAAARRESEGDGGGRCNEDGDVGCCDLASFSPVENETVFLRFLRGGTRTTGEDGRG